MKSFDTNKTGNGEGKPLCISTYLIYSIGIDYQQLEWRKERHPYKLRVKL